MAVDFIKDCSLLIGSIEVAGHAKSADITAQCVALDTTPLNTAGYMTFIAGNRSGSFDVSMMADFVDAGLDETMWGYLGTAEVAKSYVRGTADGSLAYLMRGIPLSYTPVEGNAGDLAMARISGVSSTGPVVRGKLLHPPGTARTSSGAGTARQLGAIAAGKSLYAALHVLSVAGSATPTLTVKVQSDDAEAFSTPTDRITFTGSTARDYQWGSVAGAVTDDWWRVSWTISGTSPSFLFGATAGII